MRPPHVLVFDSGVGGLSVSQAIHRAIPSARLSYIADTACFPYGSQTDALITERCLGLILQSLSEAPADVIVIACNTASTVVLPRLREATEIPVVGVVPAIKPAAALSRNRRIGLLATPATIRRPYIDQLIRTFAADCELVRIGHPDLVRWIEDHVAGVPLPEQALSAALEPFRRSDVDTIVLGCTHYPLIQTQLTVLLPEVAYWVNSGEAIARRTVHLLSAAGFDTGSGAGAEPVWESVRFSGDSPAGMTDYLAHLGLNATTLITNWPERPLVAAPAKARGSV